MRAAGRPVRARASCPSRRQCIRAFAILLAISASLPAKAKDDTIEAAGRIVTGVIPAGGILLALARDDADGAWQLAASWASAYGASYALHSIIREQRPDKNGWDSFPSDSTATAFAAASSIQVRYGWGYGAPAYAAALFVGVSRVEADRHDWNDVAAGAALGWAFGQLLTDRPDTGPEITASAGPAGGSIQAHWTW